MAQEQEDPQKDALDEFAAARDEIGEILGGYDLPAMEQGHEEQTAGSVDPILDTLDLEQLSQPTPEPAPQLEELPVVTPVEGGEPPAPAPAEFAEVSPLPESSSLEVEGALELPAMEDIQSQLGAELPEAPMAEGVQEGAGIQFPDYPEIDTSITLSEFGDVKPIGLESASILEPPEPLGVEQGEPAPAVEPLQLEDFAPTSEAPEILRPPSAAKEMVDLPEPQEENPVGEMESNIENVVKQLEQKFNSLMAAMTGRKDNYLGGGGDRQVPLG